MTYIIHLAKRFFGALSHAEPDPQDTAWALDQLNDGERALWARMSAPDRRHAIAVAHAVVVQLGAQAPPWAATAALVHDSGKVTSNLGTWARAVATVVPRSWCRERFADYKRHDAIGAELLTAAQSHHHVAAWAAQHHRPVEMSSVPLPIATVLKACDDD